MHGTVDVVVWLTLTVVVSVMITVEDDGDDLGTNCHTPAARRMPMEISGIIVVRWLTRAYSFT